MELQIKAVLEDRALIVTGVVLYATVARVDALIVVVAVRAIV